MWCCGRGLFGAGGVLGSMISVLGKASSCWAVRLSPAVLGWWPSFAGPVTPALPPGPSSFVGTSLEVLRSSFSEELVMVAEQCKKMMLNVAHKEKKAKSQNMSAVAKFLKID